MDLAFFFGACFIATAIGAYFFRLIASFFVDARASYIAGFSYAVGIAGSANFFNKGGLTHVAALAGAISALALVWLLFFKRETANG